MDANLPAAARIRGAVSAMPSLAIVLGSGFQTIAAGWTVEARFSFADLPGFFAPATTGHEQAAILVSSAEGCRTIFVSGRMHFYEGYFMATMTLPIRALARCGVRSMVFTSAGVVYVGVAGPIFKTPAEIRMFERWGGDLAGMSVVPESIVFRQCGIEVAGLSYIANLVKERAKSEIKHKEVLKELRRSGKRLAKFFLDFCLEADASKKEMSRPLTNLRLLSRQTPGKKRPRQRL